MQKTMTQRSQIKLMGLEVRTNNRLEWSEDGRIPGLVQQYFSQQIMNSIPNRKTPGVIYCAYLDYESDENGDYTFVIGEEVSAFEGGLAQHTIPSQDYVKFTSSSGPMPDVVKNAWMHIWQGGETNLGGKRLFKADFEVYDERAGDPQNTVLDIYIGIQKG